MTFIFIQLYNLQFAPDITCTGKMVERSQLKELIINNVVHGCVIGKGANGKICKGTWEGTPCAIKEIHSIFAELASERELTAFKASFVEECRRSIRLRHPNIVQFLGVYYRPQEPVNLHDLPCLVMELLHSDLTTFLRDSPVVSYELKLSILHDIALGLRYLHTNTPPIIHRDLSSNNVLISRGRVAKIGDLGTARFLNPNRGAQLSRMSQMTKAPGTVDFMPPEVLFDNPQYGTPLDVFSLACVSLHTVTHQWPTPTAPTYSDPKSHVLLPRSEVERRSSFFDKFEKEILVLKPLLMQCLKNDPKARPSIVEVCDTLLKLRGSNVLGKEKIQTDLPNRGKTELKLETAANYWDQLTTVWGSCASLPDKVQVGTVAVIDDKIYVKGNNHNCMFCYCAATNTWTLFDILPLTGYSLCRASSTKQLLAIGGVSFKKKVSNQVRLFDAINNCWCDDSITSKMKVARYNATSVSYKSSIIVIGGLIDANMSTTQTVEVLKVAPENLSSSYWYQVQSMPYGASVPMTAIVSDTLYVAGGYAMNSSMCYMTYASITELLNSNDSNASNIWSDISHLPCCTSSFTSYKEYLLIFGGDYITGASNKQYCWQTVSSIYMYHSSTRHWEKVDKIPCKYYLGRCARLTPSKMIFIGGQADVTSISKDAHMTQCMTLDVADGLQSADDNGLQSVENNGLQSAQADGLQSTEDSARSRAQDSGSIHNVILKSCRQQ